MAANEVRYEREQRIPAENIKVGDEVQLRRDGDYVVVTRVIKLRGVETRFYVFDEKQKNKNMQRYSVTLYNRCWYPVRRPIKPQP